MVLCGIWFASGINREAEKKIRQYEAFLRLLRYTRLQIDCFGLPCADILMGCEISLLSECGFGGEEHPENFRELYGKSVFSDDVLCGVIGSFSDEFGYGYREEELRRCDYYISILSDRLKLLRDEVKKKKKVNTTLCVSAALGIVILLF